MSQLTITDPDSLDKLLVAVQSDEAIAKLTLSDISMIVAAYRLALHTDGASMSHLEYVFDSNIPENSADFSAEASGFVRRPFLEKVSEDFSGEIDPRLANGIEDAEDAERLLDNNLVRTYVEMSRNGDTWMLKDKPVNTVYWSEAQNAGGMWSVKTLNGIKDRTEYIFELGSNGAEVDGSKDTSATVLPQLELERAFFR